MVTKGSWWGQGFSQEVQAARQPSPWQKSTRVTPRPDPATAYKKCRPRAIGNNFEGQRISECGNSTGQEESWSFVSKLQAAREEPVLSGLWRRVRLDLDPDSDNQTLKAPNQTKAQTGPCRQLSALAPPQRPAAGPGLWPPGTDIWKDTGSA